ncbi:Putative deoxyribonuclease YcfH [Candidatus Hydrogenisulfobacillus filiaventi]|uniref:Deoxyribonuclease YcfH n=1 Tax=Candidatus Hydrogenisulfobacillus filiaventi TaxID=2707344 RepID=A0A6F8ZFY2_9FIRM|nr:TatD family hydrolase [Bacillota bacterium]CAB1128844.1 Putative deoxyribonuclease YcfH [Candidatus Hydrogenisulfobacillus filiaventi]
MGLSGTGPGLVDAHAHLARLPDPEGALRRAAAAGVRAVLAVLGEDAGDGAEAAVRAAGLPWAAARGIHPEQDWDGAAGVAALERARRFAPGPGTAAVGEVGLPSYTPVGAAGRRRAAEAFTRQLAVAEAAGLPVVVHAVHGAADPARRQLAGFRVRAVFHWLKAPPEVVEAIVADGHWVSVTPEVVWRERDRALLAHIPPDRILAETDAPCAHDPARRQPSEPADVAAVYAALAALQPEVDWVGRLAANYRAWLLGPAAPGGG